MRTLLSAITLVLVLHPIRAQAGSDDSDHTRQGHGYAFEEWARTCFFPEAPKPSYSAKWDIPASANKQYGGIPVNPKATQYGQPVGLGDALRQFDINEPFLLIVGFWRYEAEQRRLVKVISPVIHPEQWRALWHPITRADLEKLDAVIKDRSYDEIEARRRAQVIKSRFPFTEAVITVNPKIDAKGQRRLQCSLPFMKLFENLDLDSAPEESPVLFGVPVPSL